MDIGIVSVDRDVLISNSIVGLVMFTALWWVSVNVPEYFNHAVIYMFALIVYVVFSITRSLPSYGFNTDNIARQLIVGIGTSMFISIPVFIYRLFDITISISILTLSPMAVFFIVFVAPVVEEMIFRGLILPVTSELVGNVYFGILFTAVIFALFHYSVYGISVSSMMWLIMLAIILGFITVYTESIVPAIILHMVNNTIGVIRYFGYMNYNVYTGMVLAIISALISIIVYFKNKRVLLLFMLIGIAGAVVSAYTMFEPDYSLNLYGELSALALISTIIPLSMMTIAYIADSYGIGITDKVLYATTILITMLTCLISYYIGISVPTIVLGILAGSSIAYLVENMKP